MDTTMDLKDITTRRLTDQLGSNPGGFYEGADGKKRYVKFYLNPLQANAEHLASEIYGELAPETHLFPYEEGVAFASDYVPSQGHIGLNPSRQRAKKMFETGFVPDVLLSNHDVIGLSGDNVVVDENENLHRIDNGGSLMFRAQGGEKPEHVLDNLGEWDSFRNEGERPTKYGRFYEIAGYSSPVELRNHLVDQYRRIDELKKRMGGWSGFVEGNSLNLSDEQKKRIVSILERRQSLILERINELNEMAGKPPIRADKKNKKVVAYNHFHEQIKEVAKSIKCSKDYGNVYVRGNDVWWVGADSDTDEFKDYDTPSDIKKKFKKIKGVKNVIIECEGFPPKKENWEKLL